MRESIQEVVDYDGRAQLQAGIAEYNAYHLNLQEQEEYPVLDWRVNLKKETDSFVDTTPEPSVAPVPVEEGFIPAQRQAKVGLSKEAALAMAVKMRTEKETRQAKINRLVEMRQQESKRQAEIRQQIADGDVLWQQYAKCAGDTKTDYYPEVQEEVLKQLAKKACAGCFVQDYCLKEELKKGPAEQWGIRAGTTRIQRRAILLAKPPQA